MVVNEGRIRVIRIRGFFCTRPCPIGKMWDRAHMQSDQLWVGYFHLLRNSSVRLSNEHWFTAACSFYQKHIETEIVKLQLLLLLLICNERKPNKINWAENFAGFEYYIAGPYNLLIILLCTKETFFFQSFHFHRFAESISILFYFHYIYQRPLGRRKNLRRFCPWISSASCRRIWTLH